MRGNNDPTAALLLGSAAGLWAFFKGFRVLREYKLLEDTPRIPIRSIPMGFIHIRGKAESEQALSSPLTRTPCCFYKVEIDEWKSSGDSHSWQHCCTDMDGYRFYLADDTGKVLIDAHAAEYDLPLTVTREVNSHAALSSAGPAVSDNDLLQYVSYAQMHRMTERVGQWIDKRIDKATPAANPQAEAKREALREFFAAIPDAAKSGRPPIEVLQKLASVTGPLKDPALEQKRQMMLEHLQQMEAAGESIPLPVHAPSAASGRFRLREYLVVPGQEYCIDGTCVENSAAGGKDPTMIAKGTNEPTFLISAKSDAEVHRSLRKRAALMILGGAALALVCIAGLLFHLKLF